MRKMIGEEGRSGMDDTGTLDMAECYSHCRDVLDLERHHSEGLQKAS